jgi:HAMP domain-containing protein
MGLNGKFSSVTILVLVLGLGAVSAVFWQSLRDNARTQAIQEARLIAAEATAIRSYTVAEISPLLANQSRTRFLPHTVPAFAAATTQRDLAKGFPGYSYKEAALNPTNPANRATPEEKAIIDGFRAGGAQDVTISTRDTPQGPVLSVARPLKIVNQDCLVCHSTPANAPASMIDIYGPDNGFGWNLNEIIGAQIVTVPMQAILERARGTFLKLAGGIILIALLVVMLVHLLLTSQVIGRVRTLTDLANDVGSGNLSGGEFPAKGRDEISELGLAFNRMRRQFIGTGTPPAD